MELNASHAHAMWAFFGDRTIASAEAFGNGHINDTLLVRLSSGSEFVVQRINHHVFHNPAALMNNVARVCQHLRAKYAHLDDRHRRHLTLWPTSEGQPFYEDPQGNFWRTYERVPEVVSFDKITSEHQAHQVGLAFAEFQSQLADLPAPRLVETIPDFHHTPKRLEALRKAARADVQRRARNVTAELEFVEQRSNALSRLVDKQKQGLLPERVTHNDTKLNNLLFEPSGKQALCVVDLDTVMPGLVHYDFGDMVRTATNTAAEDEEDLSRIGVHSDIFRHMVEGYLRGSAAFLTEAEAQELVYSGILLTLETGMRFLTDYLEGDNYFKTHYLEHNRVRCQAQFALVRALEGQQESWQAIVRDLFSAKLPQAWNSSSSISK